MKKQILNLTQHIYGVAITYSVLIGAVVALIYILGFIIGGNFGESMAITGSKLMKSSIIIATIGSLFGMFTFYLEGVHALTVDSNSDDEESTQEV